MLRASDAFIAKSTQLHNLCLMHGYVLVSFSQ